MARHAVSHHITSCTAPAPKTITSSPSPSQTPTRPNKCQERWQRDRRTRSPGKTNSSTLLRTRNRHQHPPPTVAMIYIPHMPAHNSATHSPMPEIAAYADTHTHICKHAYTFLHTHKENPPRMRDGADTTPLGAVMDSPSSSLQRLRDSHLPLVKM